MAARTRSASSGSRTARAPRPRRVGCEKPRIFTPPLRPLEPRSKATEKRTLGYAVIDFASMVLGIELFPWQKWLLVHALELLPGGEFRYRNVVVLVARQNGKSTLSQVLSLFFLYVLGTALVIGTAQDLDVAEEIWQGAVDIVEETPDLDALKERVVKVNGKKSLELKTGERYKVKAANRRAGRGLSGDLILLDELREHQSWDAWGAITKTTMARPNAQVWALSNAGDATSIVLRYLRKMAHAAIGDPDGICGADDPGSLLPADDDLLDDDLDPDEDFEVEDDTLGIFEWSAAPGCDRWDRDAWAEANPSLGYSITERTIASAAKTDPEWVFRTEVLCQWSDGTLEGPFPPGAWEAGQFVGGPNPPQIVGKVKASVAMTQDRGTTFIAFAGRDANGRAQVEIVARRAGDEWVEGWLKDPKRADLIEEVTGQGKGAPESGLIEALRLAGLPVVKWEGSALPDGTGRFYDAVRDNEVTHLAWPELDVAAATAVPKLTEAGSFMWDRKRSPVDLAAFHAANGAHWLLTRPTEAPLVSAYETRGVEVI